MQSLRVHILTALILTCIAAQGQSSYTYDETNIQSYSLYEKGEWKQLLRYGKAAIGAGQDFNLLRLRVAYAAYMLGNFSEAIKQYGHVLKNDSYNASAHYYTWLCRRYLNQPELAAAHTKYFSSEIMKAEKINKINLSEASILASYKNNATISRGNALYAHVAAGIQFGGIANMLQAGTLYRQNISETKFKAVSDSTNIAISEKGYYNRIAISLHSRWQLKIGYHYMHTPFNNYSYTNNLGFAAVKYFGNYFDVQAEAIVSHFSDSTQRQYNLQAGIYPLGNLNLYLFCTGSLRSLNGTAYNYKQVVGFKVMKNTWLEVNATLGRFRNLAENDAVYIYNAIDDNLFKGGAITYLTLTPKVTAQAGYTYENREFYHTSVSFNQHSITGGLLWRM